MAVTLKGQTAVYEGTSTDTKPTDADNNSIFKELDTGIRYYYDGTDWNEIPSSGGGGGGTGTDDYTDLNNKPKVNNVTVVGNLTSSDLKLQGEITNSHKLSADLVDDTNTTNKFNVQADWDQTTNSAPDYIKNKPTLGTAAAKNATDTYNATGNDVTTGKAVAAALATLPEPMVFKGSLGTGGTITTLPTASSSNKGYVYKVITAGTYASQSAKVGDTFISDGSAWVLIPSGDEPSGTVTNVAVANGGGLTVSGSPITTSGTITVGHSNSVTAKTSSSLKKFTYDANGHVTGSSELSTAESDALASGIDSTKVAQIETNKNNILYNQLMGVKNMAKLYGTSGTNNNVTYTYNSDDTITVKSDSATHSQSSKRVATFTAPYAGKFLINGIPVGASNTTFFLNITGEGDVNRNITGDDEVNPSSAGYVYNIDIYVRANVEVDTTFSIMFRPESISDSTYQPYAPSNRELYEMILALQ